MAACFRTIVDDVDAAIAFYTTHLGFRLEMRPAPTFAEVSRGDMHLYLTQPTQRAGGGARAIVLTNQKGAVLELSGRQVGLMANADLSGLAITLK